ncbi:MAG: PHP domain-containing protein [Candidatus Methanoplasma sp.]|nr:PHP domain-containing protein [Candidatus Methanoplasma sp.]
MRQGLGCIAVTDHNSFSIYSEIKDNGRVLVIPGEEVSSAEGHILAYGIDREIPRGMSVRETIDAIHAAGGAAFAAHPYRWWSGLGEKNVRGHEFDGTEAGNGRSDAKGNRRARKLAAELGRPTSAGSDAHTPDHIGDAYVDMPDAPSWQDALLNIMDGKAKAFSTDRPAFDSVKYAWKSITEWIFRGFKKM